MFLMRGIDVMQWLQNWWRPQLRRLFSNVQMERVLSLRTFFQWIDEGLAFPKKKKHEDWSLYPEH